MTTLAALFPSATDAHEAVGELAGLGLEGDVIRQDPADRAEYHVQVPAPPRRSSILSSSMMVGLVVGTVVCSLAGGLAISLGDGSAEAGFAAGAAFGAYAGLLFGGIGGLVRSTGPMTNAEVVHTAQPDEIVVLADTDHLDDVVEAVRHHHGVIIVDDLVGAA